MKPKGETLPAASSLRKAMEFPAVSFTAGVVFLALVSMYCVYPLLTHQAIPLGHDTLFHIFQADQFQEGIRSGSMYPRWAADANNGYGSPNFIFYAPLTYYLVCFVHLWETSMILSMVFVIWAGYFLSGLTMFFAARKMFGNPGSLLSAVTYQILPFHVTDLYHRGTFAELFAYPWLPLFFYFLVESRKSGDSRGSMAGLSLVYSGLILSHLVTGFIFTVIAGVYLLYGLSFQKEKKALLKTSFSLLVGYGISAIYLGPAVLERKFVHIGVLLIGIYQYTGNFLFDFRGHLFELFYRLLNMTALLEASFFLLVVLLVKIFAAARLREEPTRFLILAFIVSFFLTTPASRPVWDLIPQFSFLQFPWRWIIVMELSLCFLIARAYSLDEVRYSRLAAFLKPYMVVLLVAFAQLPMQNIYDAAISENDLIRLKESNQWKNVLDEKPEYLPIWTTNPTSILTWTRGEAVEVMSGQASVRVAKWDPEERTVEVQALSDTVIRIAMLYYPGWEFTQDGENAGMDVEGRTGAVLVRVPRGTHTIRADFEDTRFRRASKFSSLISLLLLIPVTMLFGIWIDSKERNPPR
jgi:uncharacterized membrane protein